MNNQPIGVLDSGLGGLTVLTQLQTILPNEEYIYVGDQINLPYGQKEPAVIKKLTKRIADFLLTKNIKLLVLACNTATAEALDYLKAELPIPVVGVIHPGSVLANQVSTNHRIGVIATNGTVNSGRYQAAIKQLNGDNQVFALGCPEFVSLVESGAFKTGNIQPTVDQQLAYFADLQIDTLVLGCTHFPIIQPQIKAALPDITIVDPGLATANATAEILEEQSLNGNEPTLKTTYLTTGDAANFKQLADIILDDSIMVKHIDL